MTARSGQVIALASSAGGLAALRQVLADLPADFPACVIALQHTQPERPTLLPGLLARRCALPVPAAVDGQPLCPGTVEVAPPGWHTLIASDRATSDQFSMPSASIDRADIHHVLPLDRIGQLLTTLVTCTDKEQP